MSNPDLLNTKAAAQALSISVKTLEAWRVQDPPKGPEFIRIGNSVRYPRESLIQYLEGAFNAGGLSRSVAKRLAAQLRDPSHQPTPSANSEWWANLHAQGQP